MRASERPKEPPDPFSFPPHPPQVHFITSRPAPQELPAAEGDALCSWFVRRDSIKQETSLNFSKRRRESESSFSGQVLLP